MWTKSLLFFAAVTCSTAKERGMCGMQCNRTKADQCNVGDDVQCPGSTTRCAGDQCCPQPAGSTTGTITCPSASVVHAPGCTSAKTRDCTTQAPLDWWPFPKAKGYEWPTEDCSGDCGTCVCPVADWYPDRPSTVCSCVNKAANIPILPKPDWAYTPWPKQFKCKEETRTWTDFKSKLAIAKGTFYYDDVTPGGNSRSDWHPYTNGKNATQVWVAQPGKHWWGTGKSLYYVKIGQFCMYFHINDFGQGNAPVQMEHRDWLKKCYEAGAAKYVGRVKADGGDGGMEWADQYVCSVHYPGADPSNPNSNFTVTFQQFHSLGLGPKESKTKIGYPIRITGGNADPIQRLGTPRLTTIWYSDIEEPGVKPSDFEPPKGFLNLCMPVAEEEAKAHFGHELNHPALRHDPDFKHRAFKLLTRTPQKSDLVRAQTLRPRKHYTAGTAAEIRKVLNKHLTKMTALRTQSCESMTLEDIHEVQREIYKVRSHRIDAAHAHGDKRQMPFANLEALELNQQTERVLLQGRPDLIPVVRDGRCHEAVMWFSHHLTTHAKEDFAESGLVLPLLPENDQVRPSEADSDPSLDKVHKEYNGLISCAVCHTETGIPSPPVVVV